MSHPYVAVSTMCTPCPPDANKCASHSSSKPPPCHCQYPGRSQTFECVDCISIINEGLEGLHEDTAMTINPARPYSIPSRSLHSKRSRMAVVLTAAVLLSCCHTCTSYNISRPRIDERTPRGLRPEYKALLEDLPTIETSNSMSLSFDVSESVKALNLGDKSLAAEFIDNLQNKSSFGSSPSPSLVPLLSSQFNTTCSEMGHTAAEIIASDFCPASASSAGINVIDYEDECVDVAIGVCKGQIYGYVQDLGCEVTTSQLVALQAECESTITTLTPSPVPSEGTNIPLFTPSPTAAPELTTDEPTKSPSRQPTRAPSKRPSNAPITEQPSLSPSGSPSTAPPTTNPTRSPTQQPSENPTDEPSQSPSLSPSNRPTTLSPTRSPVEGPQPSARPSISFAPSDLPSLEPSTSSPSLSPTTAEPSPQPSGKPTKSPSPKPTIPLQTFSVPTSMIFYTSDRFKGSVLETWKHVTSERIKKYTLIEIDNEGESVTDCKVDLEIVSQTNIVTTNAGNLRRLQESTTPLLVNYTTITQFYSLKDDWDTNAFVSSGFTTNSQQRSYMFQLKAADTTNFDTINRFQMAVDGTIITETPITPPEPEGGDKSTLIWAIIGAALGTLATAFLIGTAVYVRKRNKRKESDNSNGKASAFPDIEVSTKNDTKPQASSYFGTIESREGEQDDVSTLGDPYFGEAVNAVMDRDDTVAESMISAEQDMYVYGVGRPRLDTGTTSSRMDTTISGKSGNKMMFNDDTTLEDIYKTPAMNIYDQEDVNSERITVVAPSGKLGIVIDNPGGDIPIVHAIKETSALNGRIKVGDFLLSVDERDCRGMSAVAVSKLISSRSENPSRTFVILRGSTAGGED